LCECIDGFSGVDCSLNLSETPQLSGTSYNRNVFDLSTSSLKDAVLFAIKFNADDPNAVIKVKLMVTI
jgi:hypothetical protein